jgi:hypothetical protein
LNWKNSWSLLSFHFSPWAFSPNFEILIRSRWGNSYRVGLPENPQVRQLVLWPLCMWLHKTGKDMASRTLTVTGPVDCLQAVFVRVV